MSASTTPSSESLERDAAAINSHHGKVDAGEIAIGVIIGRTSEFFDFFVYAIASVVVFPQLISLILSLKDADAASPSNRSKCSAESPKHRQPSLSTTIRGRSHSSRF